MKGESLEALVQEAAATKSSAEAVSPRTAYPSPVGAAPVQAAAE
jgi:hypothetical protein